MSLMFGTLSMQYMAKDNAVKKAPEWVRIVLNYYPFK